MDNSENENNMVKNEIEIVDTQENNTSQNVNHSNPKQKKASKGYGKTVVAGCLVFGMAVGSAVTLTTMRDGMVNEITNNLAASVPANSSTDTSVNSLSSSNGSSSNVVASVTPSVVSIGILGPYSQDSLVGAGTGVIFEQDSEKTYIVTNNHVVEGANGVKIWFDGYEEPVSAKLVGTKPSNDLAVISVSNEDLKAAGIDKVVPCTFGDSDELMVGDSVIAIGNAMGEGISSTGGMISSKSKTITESSGAEFNVLQTDASINPGNSGGALVNSKGEVIGINTAKVANNFTTNVEGVGYAIPSNDVVAVIDEIMENSEKPYLGIKGFTIDEKTAELFSLPEMGVFVKDVIVDGSAYNGGIKPNDVITSFNGETVTDIETLQELIQQTDEGDKVKVNVYRDGQQVELTVEMLQHQDTNF